MTRYRFLIPWEKLSLLPGCWCPPGGCCHLGRCHGVFGSRQRFWPTGSQGRLGIQSAADLALFLIKEVFVNLVEGELLLLLDGDAVLEEVAGEGFAVDEDDAAVAVAFGGLFGRGEET